MKLAAYGDAIKWADYGLEKPEVTVSITLDGEKPGMGATVPVIRYLDQERCRALLAEKRVGRVAVVVNGVPEVVPVNYAVVDGDVVFRSGSGTCVQG